MLVEFWFYSFDCSFHVVFFLALALLLALMLSSHWCYCFYWHCCSCWCSVLHPLYWCCYSPHVATFPRSIPHISVALPICYCSSLHCFVVTLHRIVLMFFSHVVATLCALVSLFFLHWCSTLLMLIVLCHSFCIVILFFLHCYTILLKLLHCYTCVIMLLFLHCFCCFFCVATFFVSVLPIPS